MLRLRHRGRALGLGLERDSDPARRVRRGRSSNATRVPPIETTTISTMRTNTTWTMPRTTHVVCMSFDTLVDATDEMCLVGHEAARRFWPKKIPGTPAEYADVFRC